MTELVSRGICGLRKGAKGMMSVWGLILAVPLSVLLIDAGNIGEILQVTLGSLAGTLPYIALAVLLIAFLKAAGAQSLIRNAFKGRETRMIVMASLIGGLAPFCSCEVIPFIAALLAVGAPISAIMAFWLSSPLIDPPAVLITAAVLGWEFAVGKAIAAVALGLAGGFSVRLLVWHRAFSDPLRHHAASECDTGGCDTGGCEPEAESTLWRFWRETPRRDTFRSEAITNGLFLVKWLAFAYLIQALLTTYVPAEMIAGVVGGDGFTSIVIGALVGAPAYLNGYAAPALVAGLMQQGMGMGAAMAFMVAGSVSCIPAMVAVWSLARHQVFTSYVILGIAGAIMSGILFGAIMQ